MNKNNFIRFFNCPIPVTGCNLRCDYCYLVQQGNEKLLDFKETNEGFKYSVEHMLKALTPERLGGICAFHICGEGETFLWADIVKFAYGLYEMGHFVSFTSNCTVTKVINEFISFPEKFRKKMFFKCSFHYREFERLGLLERFADNVNRLAAAGISYTVELVTNDYVLEKLDEIKAFSIEKFGALPHVLTQRSELVKGKYPRMESVMDSEYYDKTWRSFKSDLFTYHQAEFDKKHNEFCYAGVYSLQFHLKDGNVYPCPGNNKKIVNLFYDIDQKPIFAPVGHNCPFDNCWFAYVTNILGGCNRDLISDTYFADFRDRVREDSGKHWLSETMRTAYGCRCSEFHEPMQEEQKLFIDLLMRKYYTGKEPFDVERQKLVKIIKSGMETKGFRNVIIYGMASLGEWIKGILREAEIEIICGIDQRCKDILTDIDMISPNDNIPEADAIIVTAYGEFSQIYSFLSKKTNTEIISVLQLI